jgi:hypothetical protein
MDSLDKELKKNEKYRELLYKQLDKDKKVFAEHVRNYLGNEINQNLKIEKEEKRMTFWDKLKNIFR